MTDRPKCKLCGLEDGACICAHLPPRLSADTEHVPEVWVDCSECFGEGEILETIHVYEAGCGFSHPDVYGKPCTACNGTGGSICEAEGDQGESEAREECARRGIDPDELCADGGIEAWMIVAKEIRDGFRWCASCKMLFKDGGTCPAIRGGCPMGGDF